MMSTNSKEGLHGRTRQTAQTAVLLFGYTRPLRNNRVTGAGGNVTSGSHLLSPCSRGSQRVLEGRRTIQQQQQWLLELERSE